MTHRRWRRWRLALIAVAAVALAAATTATAVAMTGSGGPPPRTPAPGASPTQDVDMAGEWVCNDTLDRIDDILAGQGQWGEEEYHAWWDDVYLLAERATLVPTPEVAEAGEEMVDTRPAEMLDATGRLALACVDAGLITDDQLGGRLAEAIGVD